MTNKQIATAFSNMSKIMELHDEDPFRIRSYKNAYLSLRKLDQPLVDMTDAEINALKGIGKSSTAKIRELQESGTMSSYQKYLDKTPPGVVDMLAVNGFGPKKVRTVWKEMGVESVGELLYACNENRLIELKGFGKKTQDDLIKKLTLFLNSRNKFLYGKVEAEQEKVLAYLNQQLPDSKIMVVGGMRQLNPIVEYLDFLVTSGGDLLSIFNEKDLVLNKTEETHYLASSEDGIPVRIYHCQPEEWGSKVFRYSSSAEFIEGFLSKAKAKDFKGLATETEVFEKAGLSYVLPELRSDASVLDIEIPERLIESSDIKGVIHTHTTYSDGIHSLEEMAKEAQRLGYEYIGITDHSKSAFYANGLKPDRVYEQFEAIDALNDQFDNFKIFKGIESDILNNGSLDYEEDLLKEFDFIIASVHSNLKMDEQKATQRLITAIENPYTTILGHPTGRLLLSRAGYPIDHTKVIDACAANGVHIELNANPLRLDLDWTWIPYAREKGVLVSINPDAHSKGGIQDVRYGVLAARKGMLTKEGCLNVVGAEDFGKLIRKG